MMRTIEVILAIGIVFAAVLVTSLYAKLPEAQELSTPMLSQLGSSALSLLSTDGFLGQTIWSPENSSEWANLQTALNILLPTDVVYNLTVYKAMVASEPVNINTALSFDGNDYVQVADSSSLNLTSFSIEVWLKTNNVSKTQDIVCKRHVDGDKRNYYLLIENRSPVISFTYGNNAGEFRAVGSTIASNVWYHIVGVFDGAQLVVYTNCLTGTPVPSSNSPDKNNNSLGIGFSGDTERYFDGIIDDVRVYNRSLSSSEVTEHYLGIYSNEVGLVLHLSFDGDPFDKSGNGNNGSIFGATWTQGRYIPYIDVLRYVPVRSLNNIVGQSPPKRRVTVSQTVLNPNLITSKAPRKVNATLYILNCSDANSWGLGGYTVQDLAATFKETLSPYFQNVIVVNNTIQLDQLLLKNDSSYDAVVINVFGEAVPIPSGYLADSSYMFTLGNLTATYNWTWVSLVGYPFSYITNTAQIGWVEYGIHGMSNIESLGAGLNAFLNGLSGKVNVVDVATLLASSQVRLTSSTGPTVDANATFFANKYSLYVQPYQTCTHAFESSILDKYNLTIDLRYGYVLEPVYQSSSMYLPGANFIHVGSDGKVHGVFTALGLAHNPDPRVAVLALLMHYHPAVFELGYATTDMLRIVVLELGQLGAD